MREEENREMAMDHASDGGDSMNVSVYCRSNHGNFFVVDVEEQVITAKEIRDLLGM